VLILLSLIIEIKPSTLSVGELYKQSYIVLLASDF
jgi:hypothetical protein